MVLRSFLFFFCKIFIGVLIIYFFICWLCLIWFLRFLSVFVKFFLVNLFCIFFNLVSNEEVLYRNFFSVCKRNSDILYMLLKFFKKLVLYFRGMILFFYNLNRIIVSILIILIYIFEIFVLLLVFRYVLIIIVGLSNFILWR